MKIEPPPKSSKRYLRLSSSPARSPFVVHAHRSQRSVRPEMSSIYGHPDTEFPPPRSTNRFSSSTNDSSTADTDGLQRPVVGARTLRRVPGDLGGGDEGNLEGRWRKSSTPGRKKASYLGTAPDELHASRCDSSEDDDMRITPAPPMDDTGIPPSSSINLTDFLKLTPELPPRPNPPPTPVDVSPETSRNNSDATHGSSFSDAAPARARPVNIFSGLGQGRVVHHYSPRSSAVFNEREQDMPRVNVTGQSKADQFLGGHVMMMQALLRGDEDLVTSTQRFSQNVNLIPATVERERTSKHIRPISTESNRLSRRRSASAPAKKVSLIPPPINTSTLRYHLPEDIIRTPYPFLHRKAFPKRSPLSAMMSPQSPVHDSVLILRIRRNKNSFAPLSRLVIPANTSTFPATEAIASSFRKKSKRNEKSVSSTALELDDERFFRILRAEYWKLSGFWRMYVSARRLKKMVVVVGSGGDSGSGGGESGCGGGGGSRWGPRSPRLLVQRGLSDTFSEEKMMDMFRCPKRGRARYAWVHWGHRIAAAAAAASSSFSSTEAINPHEFESLDEDQERGRAEMGIISGESYSYAGIEFVEGWSVRRIAGAVLAVLAAAVAVMLLWIFLGRGEGGGDAGWNGAADRVVAGFVMGIFVLLLGGGLVGCWAWVSWAVS